MVRHMHKKRGAGLSPVPHSKGSRIARLIETSNAESPTPMDYIDTSTGHGFRGHGPVACIQYTSRGVPVALFLTNRFEFARFLECQNQSVQLRLLCMSACCVLSERVPGNACRRNKVIMFFQRVVVLGQDFFNTSARKPQHPLVETRFIASENIGQPFACLGTCGRAGRPFRAEAGRGCPRAHAAFIMYCLRDGVKNLLASVVRRCFTCVQHDRMMGLS